MITKSIKKYIAISLLVSFGGLAGCQNKQEAGTLIGGATGALLGSRFGGGTGKLATVGLGAVAGAFLGNTLGAQMDENDKLKMQSTSNNALENSKSGYTTHWRNPDSGNKGTITPNKTYQASNGQYCREYSQSITVGNKTQQGYGTACRQPDGSWKIIK